MFSNTVQRRQTTLVSARYFGVVRCEECLAFGDGNSSRMRPIDGQHQRGAFRRDRALDQRLDEAAVLHDVELKPERLVDARCDILDRADRHRALGEGNAGRLRCAAGVDLAVAMLHSEQADRREDQRHRRGLAEEGLGLAYTFEPAVAELLRSGRLRKVLEPYAPLVPGFFLYYPSRAQSSPALRLFVEAARELSVRAV